MKKNFSTIVFLLIIIPLYAQQEAPNIRRGNRDYNKEQYSEAELDYRRGLQKNDRSFQGHYNLGNALMRQNKYPEAAEQYIAAAQQIDEKKDKLSAAQTYHNLGNAFYGQEQYDKAVSAYQQSLRLNPKDDETRYNLVKAMQMLQLQQRNQDQQQNQEQQQQEESKQEQEDKQQPKQEEQQEQQIDKETAEQILQALEQDEQETQEKLQRQQGSKKHVEKEW